MCQRNDATPLQIYESELGLKRSKQHPRIRSIVAQKRHWLAVLDQVIDTLWLLLTNRYQKAPASSEAGAFRYYAFERSLFDWVSVRIELDDVVIKLLQAFQNGRLVANDDGDHVFRLQIF